MTAELSGAQCDSRKAISLANLASCSPRCEAEFTDTDATAFRDGASAPGAGSASAPASPARSSPPPSPQRCPLLNGRPSSSCGAVDLSEEGGAAHTRLPPARGGLLDQNGGPGGASHSSELPRGVAEGVDGEAAGSDAPSASDVDAGGAPPSWRGRLRSYCFPPMPPYEDLSAAVSPASLFLFPVHHPVRRFVLTAVKSKPFERASLTMILANCIFLAMDSNAPDFGGTPLGRLLGRADSAFVVLFTLEMVFKVVALGLARGRESYLRDKWNIVDAAVVLMGWVTLLPGVGNFSSVRTIRVMRPLRTITSVKGMRQLVLTLFKSLPMLLDVMLLCGFAFFIWGTVGVQMFARELRYQCGVPAGGYVNASGWLVNVTAFDQVAIADPYSQCGQDMVAFSSKEPTAAFFNGTTTLAKRKGTGLACPQLEGDQWGVWCYDGGAAANPNYGMTSFDNILWAWLTIFQCITQEGWTDDTYATQDAVNVWVWVYFVTLIVIGSFFAVNLAIAVLYLHFTDSRINQDLEAARKRAQLAGSGSQTSLEGRRAAAPEAASLWRRFRSLCFGVQAHPWMDKLTMLLIVLNTLVMASQTSNMSSWHVKMNDVLNTIFTAYFGLEMALKLTGLGARAYVSDRMNLFDGVVVVASITEVILDHSSSKTIAGGSLSVLRTFRLLRVFKLARQWKELNKIVVTIAQSVASVVYLSLILLLFVFIMALLGMQLFGYRYSFCDATGAVHACPVGPSSAHECSVDVGGDAGCYECPQHRDCWVQCTASEWGTWVEAQNSPYNGQAFCERFPRLDASYASPEDVPEALRSWFPEPQAPQWQFLAHAGKADVSRSNFDNIFYSMLTVFQVITGENWNNVMYDGMRSMHPFAAAYFVVVVVIGDFTILNLFLAILLENFEGGGDDDDEDDSAAAADGEAAARPEVQLLSDGGDLIVDLRERRAWFFSGLYEGVMLKLSEAFRASKKRRRNAVAAGDSKPSGASDARLAKSSSSLSNALSPALDEAALFPDLHGCSLFLFGPSNPVRTFFASLVFHPRFETAVMLVICASSLTLALDSPLTDPGSLLKKSLAVLDNVFVVLFALEALTKIFVFGLLFHKGAYLRSPWNVLDFAIAVIGVILACSVGKTKISALRSLRTLRALRPLRVASRAPGMKVVVNALLQAIPAMGNVALVCLLFYLIFAILAINLMAGKFSRCLNAADSTRLDPDNFLTPAAQPMTAAWCQQGSHTVTGRSSVYHSLIPASSLPANNTLVDGNTWTLTTTWDVYPSNFDNIFNALLTLFEIATGELWIEIMNQGMDVTNTGEQPIANASASLALFFVCFTIVGAFFVLNLFVGVAIDKFNEMQLEEAGKNVLLTPEQEEWVTIQKLMTKCRPFKQHRKPAHWLRASIYDVVLSDWFERFIMGCIIGSISCLAMSHVGMSPTFFNVLWWTNTAFTAVFGLEAALKMVALGRSYFRDSWCRFDVFVAASSIANIFIDVYSNSNGKLGNLLKILRVVRVFRLVPKAKGLRTILQTFIYALPALGNVGSVLFLFLFIFSIMGMNLFGTVKFGNYLNRHANFSTFPMALFLLFRCLTGENWDGIMHECMVRTQCVEVVTAAVNAAGHLLTPSADSGVWLDAADPALDGVPTSAFVDRCGPTPVVAAAFFLAYLVLCEFLLLNLVIAVILDNFLSSAHHEELVVNSMNLRNFSAVWSQLDPDCTYYIPTQKLTTLLEQLLPPLGSAGHLHAQSEVQNIIMSVDIPNRSYNGRPHVHFFEVLHALAGRCAGTQLPLDEEEKVALAFAAVVPPSREYPKFTAAHYHAAMHVQAAVRGFLTRHNMRNRIDAVALAFLDDSERDDGSVGGSTCGSSSRSRTRAPAAEGERPGVEGGESARGGATVSDEAPGGADDGGFDGGVPAVGARLLMNPTFEAAGFGTTLSRNESGLGAAGGDASTRIDR